MSKRLLVYVEGQTEELFVNRILRSHLAAHGVKVERPILAATRREATAQRGGFTNWDAVAFDLRRLFADDPDPSLRFTTLLDVYALPSVTPGYEAPAEHRRPPEMVARMEDAWQSHFDEPRFRPYLQRHEFEALVLGDYEALKAIFPERIEPIDALARTTAGVPSREDVNGGPDTHPSARLEAAIPGYGLRKPDYGLFVLQHADMGTVRASCPRFDEWLRTWEEWGADNTLPD